MQEAPAQKQSQIEVRPMGKVEQAKVKINIMSERGKKLLARLKAKAEDKPREVLEEVEKVPQEVEVLVDNNPTKGKSVDKKVLSIDTFPVNDADRQESKDGKKELEILATPPPQILETGKKRSSISKKLTVQKQTANSGEKLTQKGKKSKSQSDEKSILEIEPIDKKVLDSSTISKKADPEERTINPQIETPKKKSLIDKLTNLIVKNPKEGWFMNWNLSLFMWEVLRDSGHIAAGDPGAIHGVSVGTPIATEGAWGFIDQHIGDTVETLELFYLSRIPVALVARAIEMATDKKINPKVKLGASLLLSTAVVSGLELSGVAGGVPDPLDLVGVGAAVVWASVGHEVIDYLFKPRETSLPEQWFTKISQAAKSMEGIDKKALAKLNAWMGIPNEPQHSDIAIVQEQVPNQSQNSNNLPSNIPRDNL